MTAADILPKFNAYVDATYCPMTSWIISEDNGVSEITSGDIYTRTSYGSKGSMSDLIFSTVTTAGDFKDFVFNIRIYFLTNHDPYKKLNERALDVKITLGCYHEKDVILTMKDASSILEYRTSSGTSALKLRFRKLAVAGTKTLSLDSFIDLAMENRPNCGAMSIEMYSDSGRTTLTTASDPINF